MKYLNENFLGCGVLSSISNTTETVVVTRIYNQEVVM